MSSTNLAGRALVQAALTITDLAAATSFYRDTLGLTFLFETNGMAFFDIAGMRLMIGTAPQAPAAPSTGCLYFDAPDLPALSASLEAAGIVFLGPAQTVQRTDTAELQLRFFRDPDENLLALMGMVRKEAVLF